VSSHALSRERYTSVIDRDGRRCYDFANVETAKDNVSVESVFVAALIGNERD